jgi:hypothetical protein
MQLSLTDLSCSYRPADTQASLFPLDRRTRVLVIDTRFLLTAPRFIPPWPPPPANRSIHLGDCDWLCRPVEHTGEFRCVNTCRQHENSTIFIDDKLQAIPWMEIESFAHILQDGGLPLTAQR